MKATNTKSIINAVAISALTLVGIANVDANFMPDVAIVIGYLAVGAIFVIASLDNRRGSKSYLAR